MTPCPTAGAPWFVCLPGCLCYVQSFPSTFTHKVISYALPCTFSFWIPLVSLQRLRWCVHAKSLSRVWLFVTLQDCSLPGSPVHGILQARILEWVAISFSRESSWPRDCTCISCIGRRILYSWAVGEDPQVDIGTICSQTKIVQFNDFHLGWQFDAHPVTIWDILRTVLKMTWCGFGIDKWTPPKLGEISD